ncbi:hypothetical protein K469DRAFT_635989 [Zopfia rhizophila CBS 207.26]|uniref:Calcium channel subunit Mid1 n=1 Tax=Zopfia rhizophila CBS 207.26 TaxID=1314779 RepID=A0A6A6DWU0_9PEZI|nr:hypothetical protein K469DRAFT_635989 [Zopfia rhizophila CBS 207.26]
MQLPKLTPLQSRLLASVIATCLLIIIWISFQPHHFVYAAELSPLPVSPEEYSQLGQPIPETRDTRILELEEEEEVEEGNGGYVPEFAYFDRSLIGRQDEEVVDLTNNEKREGEMNPGDTRNFVLKSQSQSKRTDAGIDLSTPLGKRRHDNDSKDYTSGVLDDLEALGPEGSIGELRRNNLGDGEQGPTVTKRQNGNQVYISVNTCRQPAPNVTLITEDPPQLTLYISTSSNNKKPGPDATNDLATEPVPLQGGYANFSVQADSDVYVGVSAPQLTRGWDGSWSFEVAASTDGFYHSSNDESTFLFLVDTDSYSALFITPNLTMEDSSPEEKRSWMEREIPFTMYAFAQNDWGMEGLERSMCGLRGQFNSIPSIKVEGKMIDRWADRRPKGQFYIQGLNASTTYNGFLAMNATEDGMELLGNRVGSGGMVWKQFNWTTKANVDSNCQVVFDLPFCSDTAYAVPANPEKINNVTELALLYDRNASAYYQNFLNSLDQVACNTTGTAQYSLARNCDDCRRDYKEWLCSVLMPRCEDFSAADRWLIERNIGQPFPNGTFAYNNNTKEFKENFGDRLAYNTSRNPLIKEEIQPGPYKELLPCEDLCFDIVRSCPAQLKFGCPSGRGRDMSYGRRDEENPKNITCNFPGAVMELNTARAEARAVMPVMGRVVLVVGSMMALLLV